MYLVLDWLRHVIKLDYGACYWQFELCFSFNILETIQPGKDLVTIQLENSGSIDDRHHHDRGEVLHHGLRSSLEVMNT